jgi:hypothetical protein
VILLGIDCTVQYEAMKRGEWPEPHPEVVAARLALEISIQVDPEEDEGERIDG